MLVKISCQVVVTVATTFGPQNSSAFIWHVPCSSTGFPHSPLALSFSGFIIYSENAFCGARTIIQSTQWPLVSLKAIRNNSSKLERMRILFNRHFIRSQRKQWTIGAEVMRGWMHWLAWEKEVLEHTHTQAMKVVEQLQVVDHLESAQSSWSCDPPLH